MRRREYQRLVAIATDGKQEENWQRDFDNTVGVMWAANAAEVTARERYYAAKEATDKTFLTMVNAEDGLEELT